MKYERLNALGQLLGCYFYQDWLEEFDSDISALQMVTASEPKEKLSAGALEIDMLLALRPSKDELRAILVDKAGC
ncbi:contact-dependent growth inhibition system immunity protein [Pseudomonas sp. FEN]|uniref:contact-dependent growth inhibition system immunity protein n=1 Tax=Pseudomonas sp. FEN TaxID=2767468 RepID=UPI00174EC487|nr:contact-dependent growth inhibition system immunity protein [Pseudomonas sp. FEN]